MLNILNRIKIASLVLVFLLAGCGQKTDLDIKKSSALEKSIQRKYSEHSEKLFDLAEKLAISSMNLSDLESWLNEQAEKLQPDERMPLLELNFVLNIIAHQTIGITGLTLAIARGGLLLDLITDKSYTSNQDLITRGFFFSPQVNSLIFSIQNENDKIKNLIREIDINGVTQQLKTTSETMEEIISVLKNMHDDLDLITNEQALELEDMMEEIIEGSKKD